MTFELKFPSAEEFTWTPISQDGAAIEQSSMETIDYSSYFDIPFASFAKNEKLGRIADWTGTSYESQGPRRTYHQGRTNTNTASSAAAEGDAGWSFASNNESSMGRSSGPKSVRFGGTVKPQTGSSRTNISNAPSGSRGNSGIRRGGAGWGSRFSDRQSSQKKEASIVIQPDWHLIEDIDYSRLAKLQMDPEEDAVVLPTIGSMYVYDKTSDKISTKHDRHIPVGYANEPINRSTPLEDDNTALKLAEANGCKIIASDVVASYIMSCQRSVIPWDVIIKRRGDLIFIDKRSDSDLDLSFVNENVNDSRDVLPEDASNSAKSLALELTRISQAISGSLSKGEKSTVGDESSEQKSSFRYSKLNLGDGAMVLVRSNLSSIMLNKESDGSLTPILAVPLLEYEQKTSNSLDWRSKLDSQGGAVFASEIRSNSVYLSRAIFRALLQDIGMLKIAYVSRVSFKDRTRHTILGVHEYDPYELATQMNLSIPNGFGILRAIVDLCRKTTVDSDLVLMKDPNKPLLRLYRTSHSAMEVEDPIDDLIPAVAEVTISDPSGSDFSDQEN